MHLLTRKTTTTAVVLAGGNSTMLHPLTGTLPPYMLPVFNRPLIDHTVEWLKNRDVNNIIIASSPGMTDLRDIERLRRNNGIKVNIEYTEDTNPRGTAGVLRDLMGLVEGSEDFLVINGNVFLGDLDLEGMLTFHYLKRSYLTIGVKKAECAPPRLENVSVRDDGKVDGFTIIHRSRDRRSNIRPAGLYVFSAEALDCIEDRGYFDIKEQLVPAMRERNLPVYACNVSGGLKAIESVDDYYEIHRTLFENSPPAGMEEIAENVWVGKDVSISPKSYVLGPAIIGDGSVVEDYAQIIGPAVLGKGCTLRAGTLVRESILWEGVEAGEKSSLGYCVVTKGVKVPSRTSYLKKVVVEDIGPNDINITQGSQVAAAGVSEIGVEVEYRAFLVFKRLVDVVFSVFALVAVSPLMFLVALLIKLDSPGPVFFRQKRCSKGGRDFEMLKFRTMSKGADSRQNELQARKNVDGPVFKLMDDPRVTRTGKFLRGTSLDELPQLINVIKGDMSLVGPRPLVMDEMKFSPSWRDARLKVKPGITGLWQITGRSNSSFHDWIFYDINYVQKMSLWLDLKILVKTPAAVLKRSGAF